MTTSTLNRYHPRHWILLVILGCLITAQAGSVITGSGFRELEPLSTDTVDIDAVLAADRHLEPPIDTNTVIVGHSITVLSILLVYAAILVYAVQWIVTIVGLWISPKA